MEPPSRERPQVDPTPGDLVVFIPKHIGDDRCALTDSVWLAMPSTLTPGHSQSRGVHLLWFGHSEAAEVAGQRAHGRRTQRIYLGQELPGDGHTTDDRCRGSLLGDRRCESRGLKRRPRMTLPPANSTGIVYA
ncbi:MAG TPA: hypothetical protein VGM60_19915 [Pseudonocardia sp.]|jgi:hypothetical protein